MRIVLGATMHGRAVIACIVLGAVTVGGEPPVASAQVVDGVVVDGVPGGGKAKRPPGGYPAASER